MVHLQVLPTIPRIPAPQGPTRTARQAISPTRIATNHDLDLMQGFGLAQVGNVLNLDRHRARKAGRAFAQSILGPDDNGPQAA